MMNLELPVGFEPPVAGPDDLSCFDRFEDLDYTDLLFPSEKSRMPSATCTLASHWTARGWYTRLRKPSPSPWFRQSPRTVLRIRPRWTWSVISFGLEKLQD